MDTKSKKFNKSIIFKITAWAVCCLSMCFACSYSISIAEYSGVTGANLSENRDYFNSIDYHSDMDYYGELIRSSIGVNEENNVTTIALENVRGYENARVSEIAEIQSIRQENYSDYEITAEQSDMSNTTIVASTVSAKENGLALEEFKKQKIDEINAKYDALIQNAEAEAKDIYKKRKEKIINNLKSAPIMYVVYDEDTNIIDTNIANYPIKTINDLEEYKISTMTISDANIAESDVKSITIMYALTAQEESNKILEYRADKQQYNIYLTGLLVSLGVFAIALVFLLIMAGKTKKGTLLCKTQNADEIRITKWDAVPNDVGLLLTLIQALICIPTVIITYKIGNYSANIQSYLVVILSVSLFLLWITSATKRVKRKENYTVIYMAVDGIAKAAKQAQVKQRYIWGIVGITLLGGVLCLAFVYTIVYQYFYLNVGYVAPAIILFFCTVIYIGCVLRVILQKAAAIKRISLGLDRIIKGEDNTQIFVTEDIELKNIADKINNISDGFKESVEKEVKAERMKTELITNISHDIKTPLTSILTYVDLLKKQANHDDDAKKYLDIIDLKAKRLKILTDDLFEAAKATSGNITVEMTKVEIIQFIEQVFAEFTDKIEESPLVFVNDIPDDKMYVLADGKLLFRVLSNVIDNAIKYSLENSRVYMSVTKTEEKIIITLKNVSGSPLNISEEELMERFVRGDSSRHTEGSGLGLAIAKDFMRLMHGELTIDIDGDLFKVNIILDNFTQSNN